SDSTAIVFQLGSSGCANDIEKVIVSNLRQAGCAVGLDHYRRDTDCAIAIEVLLERGLDRFKCGAVAGGTDSNDIGGVVAVAIGTPHRVRAGCSILQGHIVTASRLFRGDQSPAAELANGDRRTAKLQLRAIRCAVRIEKIIAADLRQTGRAKCLNDRRWRWRWQ